jgi:uncharacterized membrane protein
MFKTDNLHPMLVHFPIALIIIGFISEVLSIFLKNEKWLSKTSTYLMFLGTLAAIAAWTTGELFTDHPEGGKMLPVFEKHENAAVFTMAVMSLATIIKLILIYLKKEESKLKWVVTGLWFLAFCLVSYTGYLGGSLVYEFMLGN